MAKLTFEEALERINEQRPVRADEVQARALRRYVWLMMYSAPGCLPDHNDVSTNKKDALESARQLYAGDAPRGFMTRLRRHGIAVTDNPGYYRVEISRVQLRELF